MISEHLGEPRKMRPIQALDPAMDRTREILFRPFSFAIWVHLAVIIFMTRLAGCSGGNYTGNYDQNDFGGDTRDIREQVDTVTTWIVDNLALVAGISIVVITIVVLFIVLFAWLGSRGQLMLVRAVATGDSNIGTNWTETRAISGTLFMFRFMINLSWFLFGLGLLFVAAYMFVSRIQDDMTMNLAFWMPFLWLMLLMFMGALIFLMTSLLLNDLVTPLMYHFNVPCGEAWGKLFDVLWGNIWALHVFYFMRLVISFVRGILGLLAGCFTLCIGFLPVVHHGLMAPLYFFERAYGIFLLESMGPEYHMVHARPDEAQPFGLHGPPELRE